MPASGTTFLFPSFLIALGFSAIHVFAWRLHFLQRIPRSQWLSAAGGASVTYVFIHVLPELHEGQEVFTEQGLYGGLRWLEHHAYLVALLGLVLFYGLEHAAKTSKRAKRQREDSTENKVTTPGVFWLHMASFAIYNFLIGYLLVHRERPSLQELLLYGVALGLHLFVTDYGLRHDHRHRYQQWGRWILSAALLVGFAVGVATEVQEPFIALLFAFLAGAIVLNVLKEELPEERESRFSGFLLGAVGYAALLLISG